MQNKFLAVEVVSYSSYALPNIVTVIKLQWMIRGGHVLKGNAESCLRYTGRKMQKEEEVGRDA